MNDFKKQELKKLKNDLRFSHEPADQRRSAAFNIVSERFEKLVHDPSWTFGVFLRDPIKRLQSVYLMIFVQGRNDQKYQGNYQRYLQKFGLNFEEHISFEQFIDKITDPIDPIRNIHWYPQSHFCGLKDNIELFDFVGNMELIENQAKLFLKCNNLWDDYGSDGWGLYANTSMFQKDSITAPHSTKSFNKDDYAPITAEIKEKVRRFYHEDYELNERIQSPTWDPTVWE